MLFQDWNKGLRHKRLHFTDPLICTLVTLQEAREFRHLKALAWWPLA